MRFLTRILEFTERAESGRIRALQFIPKHAGFEAISIWALCFLCTLAAFLVSPALGKLVATVGFLYLPIWISSRGEDWPEFGLSSRRLKADFLQFAKYGSVIFPLFVAGYVGFVHLFSVLPEDMVHLVTPYREQPQFQWRLPNRFLEYVIDNLFVVALPEELFYRGYIQTRLRDAWPNGRVFFGVKLGRAFWLTAVLFALGHLAIFQAWRLAVFFPALLFGFMREKSKSIVGAALMHAASNLIILVLDACFFAR
jgi:uncharacterized protein